MGCNYEIGSRLRVLVASLYDWLIRPCYTGKICKKKSLGIQMGKRYYSIMSRMEEENNRISKEVKIKNTSNFPKIQLGFRFPKYY